MGRPAKNQRPAKAPRPSHNRRCAPPKDRRPAQGREAGQAGSLPDALAKSLPEQAGAVEGEARHAGRRPYGLAAPLGGQSDDLKRIRGIGPQNEGRLHGLGIWHFTQIRAWSEENVKWVGSYLAFAGRINREKWVDQARELAAGHETEFSRRVAAGKVATSKDDGSHGQGNVQIVK